MGGVGEGVGDGDRGGSGERLEVEGGERRERGEVENTTWATASSGWDLPSLSTPLLASLGQLPPWAS